MGGLTTSLLIGVQALDATQAALNATSNNIANANTPGYTREIPQFSENAENVNGTTVTGGGVSLDSIQSVRDELLNLQIQQQTSAQNNADTQSASLGQVQNLFASNGEDLASTLSAFASSLTQLSASPTSSAVQQSVLSAAGNLAKSFNTTASGLTSVQTQADQQVGDDVSQINSLTAQIAQLNGELVNAAPGSNGGTIEDQRDTLVQQLAGLTGVSVTQSSSGQVITTGNGTPLVMGSSSYQLQTATGSNGFREVLDSNGNDITSSLSGGDLGGSLQIRNKVIPGFLSTLNTLASQFATAFNAAQASGYDSKGNSGSAMFNVPAGTTGAAAGISVALTDPSQIAVSSDGSSGSNGNIANLSAVLTSALPSGDTPSGVYANLVDQVGTAASNANAQSSSIGQSLLQLTNQQSSVSGVDMNEESVNLIRFQTAYEAAARIVSTIQALSTVTLDMGASQSY